MAIITITIITMRVVKLVTIEVIVMVEIMQPTTAEKRMVTIDENGVYHLLSLIVVVALVTDY
jgi:hypothetical protein